MAGAAKRRKAYEESIKATVGYMRKDFGAKGFGLVATRSFIKDDPICPIECDNVVRHKFDYMKALALEACKGNELAEKERKFINEYSYGNEEGFDTPKDVTLAGWWACNHSCNPNARLQGKGNWVRASRPISVGEEITVCYGWLKRVEIPCYCGAEFCCGIMAPYAYEFEGGIKINRESVRKILTTAHKYNVVEAAKATIDQAIGIARQVGHTGAKLDYYMLRMSAVILKGCKLSDEVVEWLYSNGVCHRKTLEMYDAVYEQKNSVDYV